MVAGERGLLWLLGVVVVVVVAGGVLCTGGGVRGEELLWLLWQEIWFVVVGYGWLGEGSLRKRLWGGEWLWRLFWRERWFVTGGKGGF